MHSKNNSLAAYKMCFLLEISPDPKSAHTVFLSLPLTLGRMRTRVHLLYSFLKLTAVAVTAVVDILSIYSFPTCWESLWGFKLRSFALVERRINIFKRMLQIWQTSHHSIDPDPHQSKACNNVRTLLKVQEGKNCFSQLRNLMPKISKLEL